MNAWTIECRAANIPDGGCEAQILFLGDVALAGQVGDVILQRGSQFLFEGLPPGFFEPDVVCFNLECCLSRRGTVWEPKPVPLRGRPEFLSVFPRTGCRYVANLANNHFLDYGEDAAADTLEALRQFGMESTGAIEPTGTSRSVILKTRAGDVAIVGFAPSIHPLPHATRVNVHRAHSQEMVSCVRVLKEQADLVVVSLHQGVEHSPYVEHRSRTLAHKLADSGADCIICHHPHIIQGIEQYKGVPIFHSIGNFVIGEDFERWPSARESLVLRLSVSRRRLQRITVEPFVITDELRPRRATDEEFRIIRMKTLALSASLSSRFRSRVGYLRCETTKIRARALSLCEMVRHKGLLRSAQYYVQRLHGGARCPRHLCP